MVHLGNKANHYLTLERLEKRQLQSRKAGRRTGRTKSMSCAHPRERHYRAGLAREKFLPCGRSSRGAAADMGCTAQVGRLRPWQNCTKPTTAAGVPIVNCTPAASASVYISHVPFSLHCPDTENVSCLLVACGQLLCSPQKKQKNRTAASAASVDLCLYNY